MLLRAPSRTARPELAETTRPDASSGGRTFAAPHLFGVILTNHGLPVPFDGPGWANMLDAIGVYQFFDGVVNSLKSESRD